MCLISAAAGCCRVLDQVPLACRVTLTWSSGQTATRIWMREIRLIDHGSTRNNKIIKIISAPKARPHRAAGAHEAHIGPDRALRRVNDAFIRVPTAEYTRAVHLSVLPLNSATEGAEFKFVLRTARQVERMSVAQGRREG